MRSWQPVVGVFLGYFLGKYLSMALFWLPGMVIAARNISGGGSWTASLLAFVILLVVFIISAAIWLFINFFAISSWFSKATAASAITSAVMMLYTTIGVIFAILDWFPDFLSAPFWVLSWFP